MPTKLTHTLSTTGTLALACALALAACGGSGKPKSPAHSARIAFSECMRTHGVTNFPDPTGGGGGGITLNGTGIDPASPAFQSARASCTKLLPDGGVSTHATAAGIKQATQTAECMRKHGVSGFPDPIVTSSPPAVSRSQYSSAEYGNGIFVGIPISINENSPVFKAAAKACDF